jgi:polyferredoxin
MKRKIILCSILALVVTGISLFIMKDSLGIRDPIVFSPNLSLKQLADSNEVPVKEILHVLGHDDPSAWGVSRNRPIGISFARPETVRKAIEHIREESDSSTDVIKFVLWVFYLSFILLFILSRKNIGKVRAILMLFVFLLFGVMLGATPNPMESLVKLFKLFNQMAGPTKIIASSFIIFTLFLLIGPKFICSWGCPLGALQESLFNIPIARSKYNKKIPLMLSLVLRMSLFVIFLAMLFGFGHGVVHQAKDFVIWHHINYFKIFNFHELAKVALYTLPIFIISSLFIFRPFCHFICPFGLYSWILENVALNRIQVDEKKCIHCGKCLKVCPTNAMNDIYNGKRKYFLADCWSCGKCKDVCPVNAIEYKT